MNGANIGAIIMAEVNLPIIDVAVSSLNRSRTIALLITMPEAAPADCMIRPKTKTSMLEAIAAIMPPTTAKRIPVKRTGLLPNLSDNGPTTRLEQAIAQSDKLKAKEAVAGSMPKSR
ncbi:MAG: hypothetical protein Pars2KO_11210 [Parasphingorhabdus sp.]